MKWKYLYNLLVDYVLRKFHGPFLSLVLNIFCKLIVVLCLGNDKYRYVNVELIFGKTDVMRWLFSCRNVDIDEDCSFKDIMVQCTRIKGKMSARQCTLALIFLLKVIR